MKKFEIGQEIQWVVGRVHSQGCFLESHDDGTSSVILHLLNGVPCGRQMRVRTEIITLKNEN